MKGVSTAFYMHGGKNVTRQVAGEIFTFCNFPRILH
jgi:hypothetical protein